MGGAAGTYRYQTDEGTRRSVYFWSRAFPIYLHYRYVRKEREQREGGRKGEGERGKDRELDLKDASIQLN